MASTYTSNLNLRKPENRDLETYNIWDQVVNGNMDLIDDVIGTRSYTEQNYVTNSDKITASPLGGSIDKLDMQLKDVSDLTPTQDQKDALVGPPGYAPNAANPYATVNYVTVANQILRKVILAPEFAGAVFWDGGSPTVGGSLVSDFDLFSTPPYAFNYYRWMSTEAAYESYYIVVRWRIPEGFNGFYSVPNEALAIDLRTFDTGADTYAMVWIFKDGNLTMSPIGPISSPVADTWYASRSGNAVLYYDASDPILASFSAGDVLGIIIGMSSQNSTGADRYVDIGDITIQYVGL